MILKNLDNINLDNFPVAIFGSGPAGITSALELEKKNIKCVVIEAGNENYSEASQEFYKGKVIGDPIPDLSSNRLRQFGGTSGHWGGWSLPLENYTFNLWPIKAEELSPYIIKTCKILDINNQFRKSSLNEFINQIDESFLPFKIKLVDINLFYNVHITK